MTDNPAVNPTIQAEQIIMIDHPQIEALLFVDAPRDPADSVVEVRVALRDGRTFGFTAYTPDALVRLMRDSGQMSLIDAGMMIVREVSLDAVRDALDKMLYAGIEQFGLPI